MYLCVEPRRKTIHHTDLKMRISRSPFGHFKLEDTCVFVGHIPQQLLPLVDRERHTQLEENDNPSSFHGRRPGTG